MFGLFKQLELKCLFVVTLTKTKTLLVRPFPLQSITEGSQI